MTISRKHDSDMTQGTIWKQLISFALPMAIGLLFQQLYNTVDTLVVGRFVGTQALASVGSVGSIINMLVGLSAGLATGAGVIISQAYGAHDHKRLSRAVHTTIGMTLIMCVFMTLMSRLIIDPMLRFMKTPDDVYSGSRTYLSIYFSGLTGLLIYNMGSGILRAVGDSRRPLYFLIFSAVLNTVLDLLFVIRFDLGVAGVAYATIISQFVSAMLILFVLTREEGPYGIRWRKLGIDGKALRSILSVGLPSSIQQAVTSFSNVFVQSYINYFGAACMAGYAVYNKIDSFALIPVQSIALASTTFVGQNWGAGLAERARSGVRQALRISITVTMTLSVLMMILAPWLTALFTNDPEAAAFGVRFIRLVSWFYYALCFNQIYAGALRGIGNAKMPMIIMLSSFVVFRQIYLYVTKLLNVGFVAVALAYPMGWILCSTLLIICYHRSVLYRPNKAPDDKASAIHKVNSLRKPGE